MKALKIVAFGMVGAVFALWAVSFALPSTASAERSIDVNVKPEVVWPFISDFNQFQQWSPWAARDPNMTVTIEGAPGAPGHSQTWRSDQPDVGSGRQEIIEADAPFFVISALDFGERGEAIASLSIDRTAGGARVRWSFETALDGPVERWFGLMLGGLVGDDYEQGLAALKALVEEPVLVE